MPIYEYKCESCERVHEVMQKFSDQPLEKCSDCGSSVKKLMSLGNFSLKGSGWYSTGYEKSSAKSSGSAAPKKSTSKKSSSDSK